MKNTKLFSFHREQFFLNENLKWKIFYPEKIRIFRKLHKLHLNAFKFYLSKHVS